MNNIAPIRRRLAMSQAALAVELGVTQGNVSFYERGQTVPPDVARKLIDFAATRGITLTFDDVYAEMPASKAEA